MSASMPRFGHSAWIWYFAMPAIFALIAIIPVGLHDKLVFVEAAVLSIGFFCLVQYLLLRVLTMAEDDEGPYISPSVLSSLRMVLIFAQCAMAAIGYQVVTLLIKQSAS